MVKSAVSVVINHGRADNFASVRLIDAAHVISAALRAPD